MTARRPDPISAVLDEGRDRAREIAHRADPSSSKAAAADHVSSGRNAKHKQLVWELMLISERETGSPATAGAIHALTAASGWYGPRFDVVTIRRRLFDLAKDGRAARHPVRVCRVTGRPQLTWLTVRQTKLALTTSIGAGAPPQRKELIAALRATLTSRGYQPGSCTDGWDADTKAIVALLARCRS